MNDPAGTVVRAVQQRIDEATYLIGQLNDQRAKLAVDALLGVPGAVARMVELREQAAAAQAVLDDLTMALEPALRAATAEQDAADENVRRTQYRRAVVSAGAQLRAARRVDALTAELAAAMLLHDGLATLSHGMTHHVMGHAASRLVTEPCVHAVLGQLVRHQAIPREHLPAKFIGELGLVHLAAEGARRHVAMLAAHAPAEPVERLLLTVEEAA